MLPITHTTTQAHEWADASQYIIHIGRFTASICLSQMSPVSLLWQQLTLHLEDFLDTEISASQSLRWPFLTMNNFMNERK